MNYHKWNTNISRKAFQAFNTRMVSFKNQNEKKFDRLKVSHTITGREESLFQKKIKREIQQ